MSAVPKVLEQVREKRLNDEALFVAQEEAARLLSPSAWRRTRLAIWILSIAVIGCLVYSASDTGPIRYWGLTLFFAVFGALDLVRYRQKTIAALLRLIQHENPDLYAKIKREKDP
jgi:hypothetical protein